MHQNLEDLRAELQNNVRRCDGRRDYVEVPSQGLLELIDLVFELRKIVYAMTGRTDPTTPTHEPD